MEREKEELEKIEEVYVRSIVNDKPSELPRWLKTTFKYTKNYKNIYWNIELYFMKNKYYNILNLKDKCISSHYKQDKKLYIQRNIYFFI